MQCFPDTATADAATAVLKWCSDVTTAATGLTAAGDVKRMRLKCRSRCYVTGSRRSSSSIAGWRQRRRITRDVATALSRRASRPTGRQRRLPHGWPSSRSLFHTSVVSWARGLATMSGWSAPPSFVATEVCLTTRCHEIGRTAAIVVPRDLRNVSIAPRWMLSGVFPRCYSSDYANT